MRKREKVDMTEVDVTMIDMTEVDVTLMDMTKVDHCLNGKIRQNRLT